MAFKNIGLGAILSFDTRRATAAMSRAERGFARVGGMARKAGAGVRWATPSFRQVAIAAAAVGGVLGFAVGKFASFEKAMAGVSAVAVNATQPELKEMTRLAKELGATTKFTATESAEAMELFTRAGFTAKETMAGIPAVLNLAAAESMGIAEAADIASNTLRIMGLEAKETAKIADVLALTGAKANTNVAMLGEAFRYGGAQAKSLGLSLEMTSAIFGKLADRGLKASSGGTALTNMLVKMTKPSKTATKFMQKHNIALTDAQGKFKSMPKLLDQYKKAISGISDEAKRSAMIQELFGRRGAKAYDALAAAGGDALQKLADELTNAEGAAERMADIRMDTLAGQFTLLKSATEGLGIEVGEYLGPLFKDWTESASGWIGEVAQAMGLLKEPGELTMDQLRNWNSLSGSARDAAGEFTEAIKGIKSALESLVSFMQSDTAQTLKDFISWIIDGWKQLRSLQDIEAATVKEAGKGVAKRIFRTVVPGGTLILNIAEKTAEVVETRGVAKRATEMKERRVMLQKGVMTTHDEAVRTRNYLARKFANLPSFTVTPPSKPAGQMGPLPVTPGPTPPPVISPVVSPEMAATIYTTVVVDGREIARSVDEVRLGRREREGNRVTAEELRAVAEGAVS